MAGRLTVHEPRTGIDWWLPRLAWVTWAVTATLLVLQVVIWTLPPSMRVSIWSMQASEFETLSSRGGREREIECVRNPRYPSQPGMAGCHPGPRRTDHCRRPAADTTCTSG